MPYTTILFDVDDTLYPPSTGIWDLIGDRIDLFIQAKLGLDAEATAKLRKRLYAMYGTTLRGLVEEYGIDRWEYLAFVHDVPVERILQPDPALRRVLEETNLRKLIFTNADRNYAARVVKSLGLEGCFARIIDILDIWPACKPQEAAYQTALALAGNLSAKDTIFIDDTPGNLDTAHQLGFFTILVGNKPALNGHHTQIPIIHDFPSILPGKT